MLPKAAHALKGQCGLGVCLLISDLGFREAFARDAHFSCTLSAMLDLQACNLQACYTWPTSLLLVFAPPLQSASHATI